MSNLKKLALCLAPAILMTLFAVALSAQDTMAKQDNTGKSMSVTGCLKQGSDTGGYYLAGEDGKTYELWGKGLSAHVNHKVTVTGTPATMPADQEKKKEMSEKQEAGTGTAVDMKVSHVKMVSETCQ